MKPIKLQLNHRNNPLGIDDKTLRFTWNVDGGITQMAFRMTVRNSENEMLFDSQKVCTLSMNCAADFPLKSRERYDWSVTVWDENDTAYINDTRLPGVLASGTTEYARRVHYQTYEVTDLLQQHNCLAFTLTDGWYMGKLGFAGEHNCFGNQRKLLAQLEITYEDGQTETVITDEHFAWCNDGPVRYADLKDGEIYDSRLTPTYAGKAKVTAHTAVPTASPADGVAEFEHFPATLMILPSGKTILDFGQNPAGYIRFRIKGENGQKLRLQLGEVLDHGEFSRATIETDEGLAPILQETVFIFNGSEQYFAPEGFMPASAMRLQKASMKSIQRILKRWPSTQSWILPAPSPAPTKKSINFSKIPCAA